MKKDREGKMKIAVTTTRDADESLNYKAKGVSKAVSYTHL